MALTLKALHGRIMDLDSHEMAPMGRVAELFGERGVNVLKSSANFSNPAFYNQMLPISPDHADTVGITEQSVWENKGGAAPGAYDFNRRPAVMDAQGIKRQLVFPGMATVAMIQSQGGHVAKASEEDKMLGWAGIEAHNEWAGQITSKNPDRLRVVGILACNKPGVTPEWMVTEAQRLVKMGMRALFIDSGLPPAGLSPADPRFDPFYATLAEANVSLVTHPPSGLGFSREEWLRADPQNVGGEDLWRASANFIRIMTLGGVFERHPALRFGAIEVGAHWFGPLAEHLDWTRGGDRFYETEIGLPEPPKLSLRPSEYLARNVRVTPLNFEPVEVWLQRYPDIQDCYCFSTDYPHREGRAWSLKKFYENVSPLGDKIVEKFFYKNAELLLP